MRAAARLAVLAATLAAGTATAQVESASVTACRLPITDLAVPPVPPAASGRAARLAPACMPGTEGARFEVTYSGFPDAAQAAFQRAVDVWACLVRSDHVIRVAAEWGALAPGTLGSAGPALFRNFDGAPSRDVWYPAALADQLAGRDLGDGRPDIEASFNRAFPNWHTGTEPPPEGSYDLATVVLHELGHGLGLIGAMTVEGGVGKVGRGTTGPFTYDLHTRDDRLVSLLDPAVYPDGSAALAGALQSQVLFEGRATRQAGAAPVELYAPPRWSVGGSYGHLDEERYGPRTPDGLMTPFIARAERVESPGPAVCAVLADVGWTLAGGCARLVGPLPPLAAALAVDRVGPNPARSRASLRVRVGAPSVVTVSVVDARGRRVGADRTVVAAADRPSPVDVDVTGLATGVYFVVVRGGPDVVTVPVTVLR